MLDKLKSLVNEKGLKTKAVNFMAKNFGRAKKYYRAILNDCIDDSISKYEMECFIDGYKKGVEDAMKIVESETFNYGA